MNWTETLAPTERLVGTLIEHVPQLLSALVFVALGMVAVVVARFATRWAVERTGLDGLAERAGVARLLYAVGLKAGLPHVLGNLAAVVVALLVLAATAEVVGLPGVAEGVGAIVEVVPDLVAAAILTLFGFLAADFLSRLVQGVGHRRDDMISTRFAATIVYYGVLAVVLTTAAQHLGVRTALFSDLIVVAVGVGGAAAALALALASREPLRDIVSRFYAERLFPLGARIVVDGVEGTVERYDALTVTIRADPHRVTLPCRWLIDRPVVRH